MEKGVEKRFEIDGRFILSLIRVHAFKFTMRSLIFLQIQKLGTGKYLCTVDLCIVPEMEWPTQACTDNSPSRWSNKSTT